MVSSIPASASNTDKNALRRFISPPLSAIAVSGLPPAFFNEERSLRMEKLFLLNDMPSCIFVRGSIGLFHAPIG
jgi:hypothetical protein